MRGRTMGISALFCAIFMLYFSSSYCSANWLEANQTATLLVDGSSTSRKIPDTMFGISFEEINHAGAGGLWAELVSNRGFEAGGPNTPSNIDPWSIIGNETNIIIRTDRSSCFSRNEIALRMEVLCDIGGSIACPTGGAGIYNPGYWGMNIKQGETYKLTMYVRSMDPVNLSVSLTSTDGLQNLATANIVTAASDMANWTKVELLLKFYYAIKAAYPDIQLVSNCDGSAGKLDHPADLYDFHLYTSGNDMFARAHQFDRTSRSSAGPKAFVSEYAATGSNVGKGNLFSALAQAGFLIGLEINSDVVEMASNAPLFVNGNDRRWNPDAIVFNSWQEYGTPTYWMQQFFKQSSSAILHPTILKTSSSNLMASAITWQSTEDNNSYLKIKIVNFGSDNVNLKITVSGLQNVVNPSGSTTTVLTSKNLMDENSFKDPNKVVPVPSMLQHAGTNMDVVLGPHSLTSFDLALSETNYWSAI